jgi:Na+-transporting NADH:ubiquinone oxidoreductase subunit NqrF
VIKVKTTSEVDEGRWFTFGDSGARFKVRNVTTSILRDLRKKASTITMEFKNGKRSRVENINDELFEKLIQEYILEDWEGLGNEHGDVLKVTDENKQMIFNNLELSMFIWECSKSLEIEEEAKTENFQK